MRTEKCWNCGATIHLVPVGTRNNFKWVTNPNNVQSWHCGDDPNYPVKTHSPRLYAPNGCPYHTYFHEPCERCRLARREEIDADVSD